MNEREKISLETLYQLRKSDIEKLKTNLSEEEEYFPVAQSIARRFAFLLNQIRSADPAELDHLTGISAQLAMTGLWRDESIAAFVINLNQRIDRNLVDAICDGVNLETARKIREALDRLEGIRNKMQKRAYDTELEIVKVKLRAVPNKDTHEVLVETGQEGKQIKTIGHYGGTSRDGLLDVQLDFDYVSDLYQRGVHFTKGASEIYQYMSLVNLLAKKV